MSSCGISDRYFSYFSLAPSRKRTCFGACTGRCRPFIFINVLAAVFHLLNAVLTYVLSSDSGYELQYNVLQTYIGWQNKTEYCEGSPDAFAFEFQEFVITPKKNKKVYALSLFWLIFSFHFLSFVFQIAAAFQRSYASDILNRGVNPLRYVEYSVSASLMLLCISLVSGIVDLYALIALGVLCFATQAFGGAAEYLFSDEFIEDDIGVYNKPQVPEDRVYFHRLTLASEMGNAPKEIVIQPGKVKLAFKLRRIGWVLHFSGWVTMMAAYGGILLQNFFWTVDNSEVEVPEFVVIIIWSIFVLYNLFGITQLFQLCGKDPWMGTWSSLNFPCVCKHPLKRQSHGYRGTEVYSCGVTLNELVELFFVTNSLVTKTLLGWLIITNLMRDEQMTGKPVSCI